MSETEFAGLVLFAMGGYALLSALMTNAFPSRWPLSPVTKNGKPGEFKFMLAVVTTMTVVGAGILLAAMLRRAIY